MEAENHLFVEEMVTLSGHAIHISIFHDDDDDDDSKPTFHLP